MSSKTEQPTSRRLAKAREKGQFARSKALSAAASTGGALLVGLGFVYPAARKLTGWTATLMLEQTRAPAAASMDALWVAGTFVAPALGGALIASIAVIAGSGGLRFRPSAVIPDFSRVDPFKGFAQLFTLQRATDALKGLLFLLPLIAAIAAGIRATAPLALRAIDAPGTTGLVALYAETVAVLKRCVALCLFWGVGDYLWALRRHRRDLMMTRQECKEEHRSAEGDPLQKGKRKALHRQLALGGPARGVERATAVVVNPTHIAVALRYDPKECEVPYIVARARESEALQMRFRARKLGIEIVKDIPFARSLIHFDVGEPLPEELYAAAAAVIQVALQKQAVVHGGVDR